MEKVKSYKKQYRNKPIVEDNKLLLEEKAKLKNVIDIDGSYLEGGGQILRLSLALAVVTNKNVHITNIRKGRSTPGLQQQHMYTCLTISKLFKWKLFNCYLQSTEILLSNNNENKLNHNIEKNQEIDLNGAGSIGLVIQQLLPLLLLSKRDSMSENNNDTCIEIKGGTVVIASPSTFYLKDVLFPLFKIFFDIKYEFNILRHGTFPIGGGRVELTIKDKVDYFKSIKVTDRGSLKKVLVRLIYSTTVEDSDYAINTNDQIKKEVMKILLDNDYISKNTKEDELMKEFNENYNDNDEDLDQNKVNIEKEFNETKENEKKKDNIVIEVENSKIISHKGFTLAFEIIAYFENTIIYHEEKSSEKKIIDKSTINKMRENVVSDFKTTIENPYICFDEYTVDHLIIFMSLAKGVSEINIDSLSKHSKTAIYIVNKFIKTDVSINDLESDDKMHKGINLKIEGIGYTPVNDDIEKN